ncbi:hypothetical protein ACFWBR_42460 [Streptomyces sp. NPDC060006]|uniref:hypothetical protein n=1 Tax=unclassified Streptomyces TaxID=2593676 RepID=UPI0036B0449F
MKSILDSYLGWDRPEHRKGCKRPAWDIGIRVEKDEYRGYRGFGEPVHKHTCTEDDGYCNHGNTFDKTVVRIVCKSCGAARVITGERTEDTRDTQTNTERLGYGLAPRQQAGLLLWPAEPAYGRDLADELHDFVVTRTGTKQVTADAVVGTLIQGRGKLGGRLWTALAVPDPDGEYGYLQPVRFAQCNDGRGRGGAPLRTLGAAARWVAARLAEQQTTGGAA